jgi:hypothetical protein
MSYSWLPVMGLFGLLATNVANAEDIRAHSMFTGNEVRILEPNWVNADCTSGSRPDVRVATPPANGIIRTEDSTHIVNRPAGDSRMHCNGRRIDAVSVFYKSKQGFVGLDKVVILVDFLTGSLSEFTVLVDVR